MALMLALFACGSYAQNPLKLTQLNHTSWTARDGAPSEINGLAQAPDGVLWIGAGAGLFRFDGNTFTPFQPEHGEPPLPGLSVSTLSIAHDGTVWAGFKPSGVVSIYEGHIHLYGASDGLPAGVPKQILQGPDGIVWVVVEKHLFSLVNGRWQKEAEDSIPAADHVYKTFFDRSGVQWIGTSEYIYRRSPGALRFHATPEKGGLVWQFAEAPNGELWLAVVDEALTHSTVRRLDVEGHRSFRPSSTDLDSEDMLFDDMGILWVASGHGLWTVKPDINSPLATEAPSSQRPVSDSYDRSRGLTSDSTIAITRDGSGDIWIGTIRGLDRFKRPKFIQPEGLKTSDLGMSISSCQNGDVWLAVPHLPLVVVRHGQTIPQPLTNGQIYSLHCGESGRIYYTDEKGVSVFDGKQSRVIGLPPGLPPFSAKQVLELPDGTLIVPLRNGAGFWRWRDGVWSPLSTLGMPNGTALVIYRDQSQRLWAGYAKGQIGVLANGVGSTSHAGDLGDVTAFAETSYGFIAAGINGAALSENGHFRLLRFRDSLHARGISGLVETKDGDLWLNGAYGVIHATAEEIQKSVKSETYPIESELITEGDVSGPAPLTYSIPTAVHGSNGTVWFSSSNLAFYIDPSSFPRNPVAPLLNILSVAADGETVPADLRVRAGTNTLLIRYAGINLAAPERVSYRYRLDGSDNEWQDVGRRTEAIYTRLRPGHYTFHLIASNGEGTWSAPTILRFTVLPAFYQTIWFITLCALITALIGSLAVTSRVRRAAETARIRAEERGEERVRIARDLHDTLLQSVQGLLLQFQVAAQYLPADGKARKALERALHSADSVVAEGRDRVRDLRSTSLHGVSLSEALEALGEQTVQDKGPSFHMTVQGGVVELNSIAMEELFCIGREAITNAFHHARASRIDVTIGYATDVLSVICSDDGVGMDPVTLAKFSKTGHWGLVGMKERASRIGAQLKCESTPAFGTKVTVLVPASQAYEKVSGLRQWLLGFYR
jgi:signal transduction histidine kinase